ncbi:MAG: hypothetical protein Unbinned5350contig1001_45 [Prokaryotic dsDNA virus sp.]|nr:MAG: hypothetical protein Unbinned5350contig1001_45 [Prokaryotic dsDNA virus sp.]|tara:strand:- start:9967 stop:10134 length:168 start_codon:yes stop_codon:yes gene_type:complete
MATCKRCNDTGILDIPKGENEDVKICICSKGVEFSESVKVLFSSLGINVKTVLKK